MLPSSFYWYEEQYVQLANSLKNMNAFLHRVN